MKLWDWITGNQWAESIMTLLIVAWSAWSIFVKGEEIEGIVGIAIGLFATLSISWGLPGSKKAIGTYSKDEYHQHH